MGCKGTECKLSKIYPRSNASLACDCECYFDTEDGKNVLELYKQKFPQHFKTE